MQKEKENDNVDDDLTIEIRKTIVVLYFDNDYSILLQMLKLYREEDEIHRSLDTSSHLDFSSHLSDDVQKCATVVDHMSDISSSRQPYFRKKNKRAKETRCHRRLFYLLFLSSITFNDSCSIDRLFQCATAATQISKWRHRVSC